jgi:type I restriction enzyme, S subunit
LPLHVALLAQCDHLVFQADQIRLDPAQGLDISHQRGQADLAQGHFAEHFDLLFQSPEHITPLRQSILDLAVRGKLTRREAGDESAKELLKRIGEEKDKLGKSPLLRKVSEGEKPFDLPQGWEWTRWDDVSLQIGDVDHKMPDEIPDGIPYISPRDFTGKEDISFITAKKISRKDYEDLAEKIKPERGDIIFPRYGTIGVNRFVSVDLEFLASYSCCIIKHIKGLMNPRSSVG